MDNKRLWIIGAGGLLIFVLIIVLISSSCSKKNKTNSSQQTLTVWNLGEDESVFDQAILSFQQAHRNVKINYVKKDPATYLSDAMAEIAAGKGPDIWAIPADYLPKYHDQLIAMPSGKIANAKQKKNDVETYQSTYPKVVAQDNIINNQIYGFPLALDTLSLFYNTDIFGATLQNYLKSHVGQNNSAVNAILNQGPKTWDDFVTLSRLITQKSGSNISLSGASIGTPNVNASVDLLTLIMLQNGAQMTSSDLSSAQFQTATNVFGGPSFPGTTALDFFASFSNPANPNYSWSDSLGDSLHAFANGKTAMMFGYSSNKDDLKRINPNLHYQMIAVPQIRETKNPVNYASYNTFTVTKASKNADLSWDFIISLTTANNSNQYRNATKKAPAKLSSIDPLSPIITASSWYKPDPQQSNVIFKNMISQVNSGKNSQTAIEYAASQITNLLGRLKQ